MKDDSFDEFIKLIKTHQKAISKYLPEIAEQVDNIINKNSSDVRQIEQHLDTLYAFTEMGMGKDLFLKLLDYYKNFDPEGAADYWKLYEDGIE